MFLDHTLKDGVPYFVQQKFSRSHLSVIPFHQPTRRGVPCVIHQGLLLFHRGALPYHCILLLGHPPVTDPGGLRMDLGPGGWAMVLGRKQSVQNGDFTGYKQDVTVRMYIYIHIILCYICIIYNTYIVILNQQSDTCALVLSSQNGLFSPSMAIKRGKKKHGSS